MSPSNEEQLSIDLGVDVADRGAAWSAWFDSGRRDSQVQRFCDRIGAQLPQPWPVDSDSLAPPLWCDHSGDPSEELTRISDVIAELFPDFDAAEQPENRSLADEFVCFLTEIYTQHAGAEVFDSYSHDAPDSFYELINPTLRYTYHEFDTTLNHLVWNIARVGFAHFVMTDLLDDMHEWVYERLAAAQ